MGFFDSLMQNPSGSSVYGNTGPRNLTDELGAVVNLRKRMRMEDENEEMRKAEFAANLSNRQNRMNSIYGTNPMAPGPGQPGSYTGGVPSQGLNGPTSGMNTVFKEDPDRINPLQAAGLRFKAEDLANDRARINQTGRIAGDRQKLDEKEYELNVQKNKNIYDTKQADLERKREEAEARLEEAQRQFNRRSDDAEALRKFNQAKLDATEARHALERAQDKAELDSLNAWRTNRLAEDEKKRLQQSETETTVTQNPTNTERTTKIKRGPDDTNRPNRGDLRFR